MRLPDTLEPRKAFDDRLAEARAAADQVRIDPKALTSRALMEENGLLSVMALEDVLTMGMLKPDALPSIGLVQLAPGFLIDTRMLSWSTATRHLYIKGPGGRFQLAERLWRVLTLGDDWGDGHMWTTPPHDPCSPDAEKYEVQCRVVDQLETVLQIERVPGVTDSCRLEEVCNCSNRPWHVVDIRNDRWELWDRLTGKPSRFASRHEAAQAVDVAIMSDLSRYVFLDRFNASEPGGSS